jgi:phage FluMu gp28-like protein
MVQRACMDQTGLGEKPVEDARARHGAYRVEGVLFTAPVKQDLAIRVKRRFEDRQKRVPVDRETRDSLHAVKKIVTVAGNERFDAERTEKGHADEFWAAALAELARGGHGAQRWRPLDLKAEKDAPPAAEQEFIPA